jgi:hypothetical protein
MRRTHVIAALALTLAATVLPTATTSASHQAEQRRPSAVGHDAADRALHRADAALDGGDGAEPDATLALRDLARALPALDPDERQWARALLARPTSPTDPFGDSYRAPSKRTCSTNICVHWVPRTSDAPPSRAWVSRTMDVMKQTWAREVGGLGYKRPVRDGGRGGNDRFDVYLKDVGANGLFGYCAPERTARDSRWRASGYCVLDDDFARSQFGQKPILSLKATAAHEFFHAVQFAYDYAEDGWFMEATATWMEERVYDGVNDNRRYLDSGQLAFPGRPLDVFEDFGAAQYGNWVFFEYLSGQFGTAVVRSAWQGAGAVGNDRGLYSIQAVADALPAGTTFLELFGDYTTSNTEPSEFYPEGDRWPAAPAARRHELTSTADSAGGAFSIDHLASRSVRVVPGADAGSQLEVSVNGPAASRQPVASVVVHHDDGTVTLEPITLNGNGLGSVTVDFDRRATITLANASTSFNCWEGTAYSCRGIASHDDRPFTYAVTAR